ncbi:C13 family peptidase [Massilia pseudoviolaceinigra]|uniref:C13 family peptidase n=1 Tax=Massilia pseudoviolaceinigra TaxID=3057165 RepID=UPI0027967FE4|nr:C13 family peptidase [Massilia sp. CCM 9206]MDQ1922475.1 C13 family peptidase [Massilia sp. CCM 9206]
MSEAVDDMVGAPAPVAQPEPMPDPVTAASPAPRASVLTACDWLGEGARSMLLLAPRWERLVASPWQMAFQMLLQVGLGVLMHRLMIEGDAIFIWRALLAGWSTALLTVWLCYLIQPDPRLRRSPDSAPGAAHLYTLLIAQSTVFAMLAWALYFLLIRTNVIPAASMEAQWALWFVPMLWSVLAKLKVLIRAARPLAPERAIVTLAVVALTTALGHYLAPAPPTWRAAPQPEAPEEEPFEVSQEMMEAQLPLLGEQIDALKPQRPGVIDMYTITFAPYEGEEVFRRESAMVSDVMARRFDAAGRGLQLINHHKTADTLPWATPLNLERAIEGIAGIMDRDEDVLFIHLTSHGASDGELAASFWPIDVAPVLPPALKGWLDQAGIRYRVLSISACYAGNWIAPLAADGTLVMTASDADHTSYGCGKKSPLTFFGRAMYDEQLRTTTRSFTEAHAAARKVILQRETQAGKDDGYSNPQIKVGSKIVPVLERLNQRLAGKP